MSTMHHPKGLPYLFLTEMWERFSFYGISALLVLYLTEQLNLGAQASLIFGTYITYLYITTALGGIIADRLIGYQRCVYLGGSCIAIGNLFLVLSFISPIFAFIGLGFISSGTGLFKSNVTVIVGRLYDERESLRTSGFAYFYAGINFGALLATFLVGYVGLTFGWHYGFLLSAIGMFSGLLIFWSGKKHYPSTTALINPIIYDHFAGIRIWHWMIVGIISTALIFAYLIANPIAANIATTLSLVVLCAYVYSLWKKLTRAEKKNIFLILFLSLFMVLFWSFHNQQSISFPVYIRNFVDHNLMGFAVKTTTIMGFYLVILTLINPIIGFIWQKLANKKKEPGDDIKFSISLFFIGFGFAVIGLAGANVPLPVGLIMTSFMFVAIGELCISPVGLSLVTRLAPRRLSSTMMGIWWTISAYAGWIGGYLGSAGFGEEKTRETLHIESFNTVYFYIFVASVMLGFLLILCIPTIRKLSKA